MINQLRLDQQNEVNKNDYCKSEFHQIDIDIKDLRREIYKHARKLDEANGMIANKQHLIEMARLMKATAERKLQKATRMRNEENYHFTEFNAAQTITIQVLNEAIAKLKQFYKDEEQFVQLESGKGN